MNCLKRGVLTVFGFRGGGRRLGKKEDGVFLRGVDTPMHTMNEFTLPYRSDTYCAWFFNLLFGGTALLTWYMLLIWPEGNWGTMWQDWATKPGQAPSRVWAVILPILKVIPYFPHMGCYCNNQFHSVTRHLVAA